MMDYIAVVSILAFAVFFVMGRIFKAFKGQGLSCCAGDREGCVSCAPDEICMKDDKL
jgi:hypothetical protein